MAKTLMIRPQMAALWGPRFFSTISSSPAAAIPFRRQLTSAALLLQKLGPRGGSLILGQKPNDLVAVNRRSLCVRASTTDSGFIDSPLIQSMENKIKEQLSADSVVVRDINGDGRHVCIDVIASSFEGKSAVNRQRMVYKAIWEELQNTVHAVDQMTTKTPSEAGLK